MSYKGALDCPRHHSLYDLDTGENRDQLDLVAGLTPLPLYAVKEEAGWIWVFTAEA